MSAHGNNPEVHRIVDGRFVCSAPDEAACRNYSACECEYWSRDLHGVKAGEVIGYEGGHALYAPMDVPPQPGHEPVPQDECWITPWIEACDLGESYGNEDFWGARDECFPDGPVDVEFDGDQVLWTYSDGTKPAWPNEDDA